MLGLFLCHVVVLALAAAGHLRQMLVCLAKLLMVVEEFVAVAVAAAAVVVATEDSAVAAKDSVAVALHLRVVNRIVAVTVAVEPGVEVKAFVVPDVITAAAVAVADTDGGKVRVVTAFGAGNAAVTVEWRE